MVAPVTSGLIIDLVAATMGDVDGASIGNWSDSSPAGAGIGYYSGGPRPVYRKNYTPGGGPAIHFEHTYLGFNVNAQLNAASSAEFFAVVRDVGNNGRPGFYRMGGFDYPYYPHTDGTIRDGSFTNSSYAFPKTTTTNWHIYNVSHDGTTRTTRIDGVVVHTVAVGYTAPSASRYGDLGIGTVNTDDSWIADLAEVITYSRSLTDSERTQVYNYLNTSHFTAPVVPVNLPPIAVTINLTTTASAPAVPITMPPIAVKASLSATASSPMDAVITLPPLGVGVTLTLSETGDALLLPALSITLAVGRASSSSLALVLSAPDEGAVVATSTPQFMVGLDGDDATATYTIEVQYADDDAFTTATTLSTLAPVVSGGALLTPTSAVPAHTWWRARLLHGTDVEIDWIAAKQFTVDTDVTVVSLILTWTVNPGADAEVHLWHLDPPGVVTGDTVTAFGHGFGPAGTVLFGDDPVETTSWQLIPATAAMNTDDRRIDGDTVDCEHYEVVFTAPATDGPGDAITVEA